MKKPQISTVLAETLWTFQNKYFLVCLILSQSFKPLGFFGNFVQFYFFLFKEKTAKLFTQLFLRSHPQLIKFLLTWAYFGKHGVWLACAKMSVGYYRKARSAQKILIVRKRSRRKNSWALNQKKSLYCPIFSFNSFLFCFVFGFLGQICCIWNGGFQARG